MMRLKLFVAAILLACATLNGVRAEEPNEGRATGLKVILVGDTKAFPKGDAAFDIAAMKAYLGGLPGFNPDRDLRVLTGDDVTAEKVLQAIDDLDVAPTDALLCYYDGHGAYDPDLAKSDAEGGHHLQIDGGDLLRSELMRHLMAKGARLTVLITETCNGVAEFTPSRHQLGGAAPLPVASASLEHLLFDFTGVVDVNAAAPDQSSWSTPTGGSWFTQSLLRTLDADDRFRNPFGDVSGLLGVEKAWELTETWGMFLDRVSEKAHAVFQEHRNAVVAAGEEARKANPELIAQEDQRPQVFQLDVRRAARPESDDNLVPDSPFGADGRFKSMRPAILDHVK